MNNCTIILYFLVKFDGFFHRYIYEHLPEILFGCIHICHFCHTLSGGLLFSGHSVHLMVGLCSQNLHKYTHVPDVFSASVRGSASKH